MSRPSLRVSGLLGFVVATATLLLSSPGFANVSLKNGNFFIAFTDIFYPGGFEPRIERVYNSKTPFQGIFGWGWGNEYEVYLTVSADGSVVVHEYGGGAENRFNPGAFNAAELDKAVEKIAAAAQKAGTFATAGEIANYKRKLKSNADFRNDEWERFRSQRKLESRQLAVGMQLHSNRFSYQYVTKVQGGYVRTFDNGKVEKYAETTCQIADRSFPCGKLVRVSDKNSNSLEFHYTKDGRIQKVVDNFNRKMFFTFNSAGLLEKIEGENGKVAEFKYNSEGELIASRDVEGNAYTYKYDTAGRHNMTQIGYASDKSTQVISYFGLDKHENVKSVKERDGTLTEYGYDTDKGDKSHYAVSVGVKGSDGKSISQSRYEYVMKTKADGEEWLYQMITSLDGDRTQTTYNECCGLPLIIKHGDEETTFEYDKRGHVTKKMTPVEVTELSYDPKVSKVSQVKKYSKTDRKMSSWSKFRYDEKGNLVFAQNSENKGVQLFYDSNGRIRSLMDQSKRQITFKYNENSKPIEISDPKLGTITVTYANSGEIKKVESTAGRKIALQVTSAFQNLLDIIRPAGVNLSF